MSSPTPKEQDWYTNEPVCDWHHLTSSYVKSFSVKDEKVYWIFRGARLDETTGGETEGLRTHIERAFDLYGVESRRNDWEKDIIREFQRKASLYVEHLPDKDDILEWLALMRHYGAPTRLLDWTYSFFVALYFSLARNKTGVVWAFNARTLSDSKRVKERLLAASPITSKEFIRIENLLERMNDSLGMRKLREENDKLVDLACAVYLFLHPTPFVYSVNPFRLNQRLSIQQGLFLFPGSVEMSFEKNLRNHFSDKEELRKGLYRIVIKVNGEERKRILQELHQMNIGNATLFPGLDGFATSLAERLAQPEPA